jgi:hypothetical protein
MPHRPTSRSAARALVPIAALTTLASGPAAAHVKWFTRDADCAMPPLSPLQVISSPDFLWLGLVSLLVMVGATLIDARLSRNGSPALAWADALDARCVGWLPRLLRLGLAAFFCIAVLYFGAKPVFLTPELHAIRPWVPALQLGIAVTLLWRPTAWLGALGIAVLYGSAVLAYGWFHLLDYPVFLAAAGFVAIDSLGRGRYNDLALALLRVGAGVTLMWAGAEKWLYPWWSDDVLNHQLRAARGDYSSAFFMAASGWVEFCAAYALVFGRLGTQVAAWALLVPFLAAIPVFGELDAIGHAPIVVVLVMLGLTRTRLPVAAQGAAGLSDALRRGATSTLAALAAVGVYWALQALAYRRLDAVEPGLPAVAVLLAVPLLLWWGPRLTRGLAATARESTRKRANRSVAALPAIG